MVATVLVVPGFIRGPSPAVVPPPESELPGLPSGWPSTLQLGMSDGLGGATVMRATTEFGLRYQYLAAGVNTGHGWATWEPEGRFVNSYILESVERDMIPVFTYYMIVQSAPGNSRNERDGVALNLANPTTMAAYYDDLELFFRRAGAFPATTVVLHVEPDLWGFTQQRARDDDAASVPVMVAATGRPMLADLPDTLVGFAGAIGRLRDSYAPNVLLGYHLSAWGTGTDIQLTDPSDATVDELAQRAAKFFLSLHAPFDVSFAEFSDRDAGYYQYQRGDGGKRWWNSEDFRRHARFLGTFARTAQQRVVLWQIPFGNTRMRAVNNTWNHYQDNRVEWLLDDPSRVNLADYVQAGAVAMLFGRGADGATCACDGANDGVTDPAPINGNAAGSLNADDDGGFFRRKAADYYDAGAMPLP